MDQSIQFEFAGTRNDIAVLLGALNDALSDKRDPAEERLRRAADLLRNLESWRAAPGRMTKGGLAPWQVRRVIEYIDANLQNSIRNEDLAKIARLTACHFGRAFRCSVGEAPHAYIIRRRMDRAQQLMLTTSEPLSFIAFECGLADQAHFSRLFRRLVGESPRDWRRAHVTPSGD